MTEQLKLTIDVTSEAIIRRPESETIYFVLGYYAPGCCWKMQCRDGHASEHNAKLEGKDLGPGYTEYRILRVTT